MRETHSRNSTNYQSPRPDTTQARPRVFCSFWCQNQLLFMQSTQSIGYGLFPYQSLTFFVFVSFFLHTLRDDTRRYDCMILHVILSSFNSAFDFHCNFIAALTCAFIEPKLIRPFGWLLHRNNILQSYRLMRKLYHQNKNTIMPSKKITNLFCIKNYNVLPGKKNTVSIAYLHDR